MSLLTLLLVEQLINDALLIFEEALVNFPPARLALAFQVKRYFKMSIILNKRLPAVLQQKNLVW
jgi:hypothetical protein